MITSVNMSADRAQLRATAAFALVKVVVAGTFHGGVAGG
jgi:hypothetical protein